MHIYQDIYIYISIYIHIYTYTHAYAYAYMCTYAYARTHTHIHAYIETFIHLPSLQHACVYILTYIHTYLHTYINTYTHTHTYTHTCIHAYMHTSIHTSIHPSLHTCRHTYIHTLQVGPLKQWRLELWFEGASIVACGAKQRWKTEALTQETLLRQLLPLEKEIGNTSTYRLGEDFGRFKSCT